jgi:hypothetical protein
VGKLTSREIAAAQRLAYLLRLDKELHNSPDWATANSGHFIINSFGVLALVLSAKCESVGDRLLSSKRIKYRLDCCLWSNRQQFFLSKERWLSDDWRLATKDEFPPMRNPFSKESVAEEEDRIEALLNVSDDTPF